MCRAAGYTRVFGGMPSPALGDPHEFLIGRVRVDPTDWLVEFHLKLMGAYDWVPFAADLKRRIVDALRIGRGHRAGPLTRSARSGLDGVKDIARHLHSSSATSSRGRRTASWSPSRS